MSGISKKLIGTTAAAGDEAIEDVFSTYLYTGNGSTQTITNGIDLAGKGGLVWFKARSGTYGTSQHALFDTDRGVLQGLASSLTSDEATEAGSLTAFNSDGFDLGSWSGVNGVGSPYASWTFRKAPRFFDVVTWTGDGVAGREIAHNLGTDVGMLVVKSTSHATSWKVQHRSTGPTNALELDGTRGATDVSIAFWNNTAPTDTHFTVGTDSGVNQSGRTYVAYLFAHDPLGPSGDGSDGLIACGSYTGNGSTDGPEIDLGWEPQWVMIKQSSTGGTDWYMHDNMRGIATGGNDARLKANLSEAEFNGANYIDLKSTGFKLGSGNAVNNNGETHIYIAIRRGPMKTPESGAEVFDVRTDLTASRNIGDTVSSSLPYVDWHFSRSRALGSEGARSGYNQARLSGWKYLRTNSTNAEAGPALKQGGDQNSLEYVSNWTDGISDPIDYFFKRAPGFFDVVAYTGDGLQNREIAHNLAAVPELVIIKRRTNNGSGDADANSWAVWNKDLSSSNILYLDKDQGTESFAGDTYYPSYSTLTNSGSSLSLRTGTLSNGQGWVNSATETYIAYLFATLPGVSKVGSYTGNGTSQTINCGFTSGARFILIKRTDSAGDWYVWDTARGIVAGDDPFLELNTTDAEVTTDDSIDPDSSGFVVNQTATTNINVNSGEYIFYAVA